MSAQKRRARKAQDVDGQAMLVQALALIAREHHVDADLILGRLRHAHIARARSALYVLLHDTFGMSTPRIGALLNRDHSTIVAAVQKRREELREELREGRTRVLIASVQEPLRVA